MADQQQMKTSFLFIQLQSPSKSAECSQKAYSLADKTVLAESRKACDSRRPDCPVREEAQPAHSKLQKERSTVHSLAYTDVSCLDICTAMNNGTESHRSANQTNAVSLDNTWNEDCIPDCKGSVLDNQLKDFTLHNKAFSEPNKYTSDNNSSALNYYKYVSSCCKAMDHQSNVNEDKVRWKVELCKPMLVKTPNILRSPENKSFQDAVEEKSTRLSGFNLTSEGQILSKSYTLRVMTANPVKLKKTERYVWVNSTSAHTQNVAKAKYEFLFGEAVKTEDEEASDIDEPGNTRLLPQTTSITNEFPEYGTTDNRDNETFRTSYGYLMEPTQYIAEIKEPGQLSSHDSVVQNDCLTENSAPCLIEKQGNMEKSEDTHSKCAPELIITSGEVNTGTLPYGPSITECPSLHVENNSDSCNPSSRQDEQVERVLVSSQVNAPEDPLTPVVPIEKKSYFYVERELAAISEEETVSESSLSQITEIADFPKSQHNNIPVAAVFDHIPLMEENINKGPFEANVGEKDNCIVSQVESPDNLLSTKNAANSSIEVSKVQKEMLSSWIDIFPSTTDAIQNGTMPLVSTGTSNHIPVSERTRGVRESTVSSGSQCPKSSSDMCLQHEGVDNEVFLKETDAHDEIPVQHLQSSRIVTDDAHEDGLLTKRCSEDSTDLYSSQFENILDNTSLYYSVESLDTLYYEPDSFFSFEMPLTPMIQQRIKESSHFLERNIAAESQQEFLKIDPEYGISMGYCNEGVNGLDDVTGTEFRKVLEVEVFSARDEGPFSNHREASHDMDSTENLSSGTSSNQHAAKRLAKRLFQLDGFRRSDVAKHLGKNNDFSRLVAEEYLNFFDFTGMSLDQSLRRFFKSFSLIGETQERERVLIHFSKRFFQCNPNSMSSPDRVHCLTCALMLLNTDLHGRNIGKKMSCQEFIANLQGVNEGSDFPRVLLKALYNSIKNEKLEWAAEDVEALKKSPSDCTDDNQNGTQSKNLSRIRSSSNPFLEIPHDPNAAVYKTGFLARKIHADMDEKKTPRGKRGWKSFYATLKGTVLYLQKDEYEPEKPLSEDDLKNSVSLHHALASKATEYQKRPNVLKIKTADWRVFLFQAQSTEDMEQWITKINCVAAVFSAPAFPAAIGSQKKFGRPLLPAIATKLSEDEQLKSHETKLKQISTELSEHRSYPPDKKVKAKDIEEYKMKDHYLEFEKTRYEIYVKLLKEGGKQLLILGENENSGLKKSHSSPSLTQDSSPSSAKVKRNISERKDYRPETPSIKPKAT
ncbi:PH and SEC7 domain-containing protein 3-like [Rhinophrynus dorsalis]